jgi:hypothetical protein
MRRFTLRTHLLVFPIVAAGQSLSDLKRLDTGE